VPRAQEEWTHLLIVLPFNAFHIGSLHMQKPVDLGHKTIDAAAVSAIKPVSEEQLAQLRSTEEFKSEARAIGSEGGYTKLKVEQVVAAFAKLGESLTYIKETGEAVRRDWIVSVKPFAGREGGPDKFHSVARLRNPHTNAVAEEWFAATPAQLTGATKAAPKLEDLAKGPRG
jgi:hypothetical protein